MSGLIRKRNDIKVFILFVMSLLDYPIDHNTLNDLCVQDNYISPFDFSYCIEDLCKAGCVSNYKNGDDDMYELTANGKVALDGLIDNLLPLVRDRAMHSTVRLLSFEKAGGKVNVDIEKAEHGYTVNCQITKKGVPFLSISINAPTKSQADRMERKLRESPEEVFRGMSSLLLGDIAFL